MASADWSIAVGVIVFIIAIVFSIILFIRFQKWSIVLYIASLATYTFAFFYTWDVFELKKNTVLILLVISAVIMLAIGRYFSKIEYSTKGEKHHGK